MVWGLLLSVLLLCLVAFIESMSLSVLVSYCWLIKPAICTFNCSILCNLVTKHLEQCESHAPATSLVGTYRAFERRYLHLIGVFSQTLSHFKSTQLLFETVSTAIRVQNWCVKWAALQGRDSQLKRQEMAFVKWISEIESVILFHYR